MWFCCHSKLAEQGVGEGKEGGHWVVDLIVVPAAQNYDFRAKSRAWQAATLANRVCSPSPCYLPPSLSLSLPHSQALIYVATVTRRRRHRAFSIIIVVILVVAVIKTATFTHIHIQTHTYIHNHMHTLYIYNMHGRSVAEQSRLAGDWGFHWSLHAVSNWRLRRR